MSRRPIRILLFQSGEPIQNAFSGVFVFLVVTPPLYFLTRLILMHFGLDGR